MGAFNPKALIRRIDNPAQPAHKRYEAHFEGEPFFAYGASEQEAAANLWRYYENRDENPSAEQRHLNNRMASIGQIVGLK